MVGDGSSGSMAFFLHSATVNVGLSEGVRKPSKLCIVLVDAGIKEGPAIAFRVFWPMVDNFVGVGVIPADGLGRTGPSRRFFHL
jgi:hypothetical protein